MSVFTATSRFIKNQTKLVIGIAAGLLLGGTGTAVVLASVPDTSGVIHACYKGSSVRIIDTATQACNANETAVSWNSASPGQFVTNLVGADFSGVSLVYRNFVSTDIHDGIFTNTVLRNSDLSGANLSGSVWNTDSSGQISARNVRVSGTNLANSTFRGTIDFTNTVFTTTNLSNTNWNNATIIMGDFRGASIVGAQFSGGVFSGSNFSGTNFSSTVISGTSFKDGANISQSSFTNNYDTNNELTLQLREADVSGTNFSHAGGSLRGAGFQNSIANNTSFANIAIVDSYFVGTDLSSSNLSGVTWVNTYCPDNSNSDNNGNTCSGHLVP